MSKAYYIATVREFLEDFKERIVGCLNEILEFDREIDQQVAWEEEIAILKEALGSRQEWQEGAILFEYSISKIVRAN